jgi:hypothetical protein
MDKKRTLMAGVALFSLALAAALPFAPSIIASAATATANFTVAISPPAVQTIVSIAPTSAAVTAPCSDGTIVTGLTATMSNGDNPPFSGTWSESGDANFRISGANLVCNGSVVMGSYTPTVTATPNNGSIAPKSQQIAVTVQTGAQTIASITPPIAAANTAPCSDGTEVTVLTATLTPNVPLFVGTWSESGDTHFRISGNTLVCNGSVAAGTYTPTVTATPADGTIASKSQAINVTVQTRVSGTCGVGAFSGSICPPVPDPGTTWVYQDGDEFNYTGAPDFTKWDTTLFYDPEGSYASACACQVLENASVANGLLHLTPANPSHCATQPPWPAGGACSSFAPAAAGPAVLGCFGPGRGHAPTPASTCVTAGSHGAYAEFNLTANAQYYAAWFPGINGSCGPPSILGVEADMLEDYGGGAFSNLNYGGYSPGCSQPVIHAGDGGVNFSGGAYHLIGMLYHPTKGLTYYRDGNPYFHFDQPLADNMGGPEIFAFGNLDPPNGGDVFVKWFRWYQAR